MMKAKVLIAIIIVIGIISLLIGCPDAIYPETTTTSSTTTTSTIVTTTTSTTTTTTLGGRIAVSYGATTITPITSGDTTVDYGMVGSSKDITFIITNKGDATLDLIAIDISENTSDGINNSGFELDDTGLKASIKPDGTTDFIIIFHSIMNSSGYFNATVSIKNNDPDEQDFNFDVTGDAESF